jgi:hypothetical protein
MKEDYFNEISLREEKVTMFDSDIRNKNRDKFQTFLLHMTVLSSALAIGILPLINESSKLILAPELAKFGLLINLVVCTVTLLYAHNVLNREKQLINDQKEHHDFTFDWQRRVLSEAIKRNVTDSDLRVIFEQTKSASNELEQEILMKHLVGNVYRYKIKNFLDRAVSILSLYGFALGTGLVVISFIIPF